MKLLILGAGQYGEVAREIAEATNMYSQIVFLDDNSKKAVGMFADLENVEFDKAIVAIGNPDIREQLIKNIGEKITTLIHPRAVVMSSSLIEKGCIVEAGAQVCSHSKVGLGTIIMANAVVGHDSRVGRYCQLKYNSTVSDSSAMPDKVKLEYNAVWK